MFVEPRTNVQKKLTCIKIEHVRDILNQARNPNRVSLAKGKKEKKSIQTNNNKQKLKRHHRQQQQRRRQRQKYKQTIIIHDF